MHIRDLLGMHKVESNRDLRGVKGIGESLCDLLGIEMERRYLRLSGDYQGEGTHTLLEIYQSEKIRDPWGNDRSEVSATLWGSRRVRKSIQDLLGNKGVKTTALCGEFTVGNLSMTCVGDKKWIPVI